MALVAQISDLHIRPRGHPASRVVETNKMAARAVARLAAMTPAPDAVIASGDLVDRGLLQEYEMLREILEPLPMPVYFALGNHDDRDAFRSVFGDRTEFPASGPLRYGVDIGALRLVVLDSLVPGAGHGFLEADCLSWLDMELAAAADRPVMIMLHHPPITCGIENMDRIRLENALDLAEIVARHDNVVRIVAGHHHRPITTAFAGAIMMVAPSIAHQVVLDLNPGRRGMFAFEPPAFYLHLWVPDHGLVSHMAYVESYDGPYPFWPDKDFPWTDMA